MLNSPTKLSLPVTVLTLLLTACTTPNQLRSDAPIAEFSSNKEAKKIAKCIVEHWEDAGIIGTPNVLLRTTDTGFNVSVRTDNLGVRVLADIFENGAGSKTKLYIGITPFKARFTDSTKDCQV